MLSFFIHWHPEKELTNLNQISVNRLKIVSNLNSVDQAVFVLFHDQNINWRYFEKGLIDSFWTQNILKFRVYYSIYFLVLRRTKFRPKIKNLMIQIGIQIFFTSQNDTEKWDAIFRTNSSKVRQGWWMYEYRYMKLDQENVNDTNSSIE